MDEQIDKAALLARTPEVYLADGYLDVAGEPRAELLNLDATAAVTQLMAAELPPQELGFTVAAIGLLMPAHDEPDAGERLHAVAEEAVETVARAIQQPMNEGFLQWLSACVAAVDSEGAIGAFQRHIEAVNQQYGVLAALLPFSSPLGAAAG